MRKDLNTSTDIPGSNSPAQAAVAGTTCPKCGQPITPEYGTLYCHKCRVIVDPKPKTNADRIRSMSDEELAVFMNGIEACEDRPLENCCMASHEKCIACTLDWLKQPAKEV